MTVAMFVLAIIFLLAAIVAVASFLLDEYVGEDMAIPGVAGIIITLLSGSALAILAIVNFGVSV